MSNLQKLLDEDWRKAFRALIATNKLPFWTRCLMTVTVDHPASEALLAGTLLVKLSKARLRSTSLKLHIARTPKKLSNKDVQTIAKIMSKELTEFKRKEETGFYIRNDLGTPHRKAQ